MFSLLPVSIGITDKMNAAGLICMQECRQTMDRTNGHLVDSYYQLIELSSCTEKYCLNETALLNTQHIKPLLVTRNSWNHLS